MGELCEEIINEGMKNRLLPQMVIAAKLAKPSPSKFDHFHEKTYINGFVPKFNFENLDELSWKMPQTTKSAHKPRMSHNTLKWHPSSTNTSPKLSKSILRKSKHLDIPEPPKSAVPMARAKFTSRRSEYKHKVASMPSRMMIVMPDA